MIKRKVFIIKGYSTSEREKSVDEYYVNWYKEFFMKPAGGAYVSEEIVYLSEPNHKLLDKKLNQDKLDYGIIVYIGHGANNDENQIFQLNQNEIIKAGQFILDSEKQIVILESCRVSNQEVFMVDLEDKIPAFEKGGILRDVLTSEQSREIYDSHIKRCEKGIMICYACKLGEEACNFVFSKMFLQHAFDWHLDSTRHCAILPVDELMRLTVPSVVVTVKHKFGINQWPVSSGSTNFPIAVSKF